eukprot:10372682-Ditylum_brightwellii.AAC.1
MGVNCQATAWQLTSISNYHCIQDLGGFFCVLLGQNRPSNTQQALHEITKMTVATTTRKISFLLPQPPSPRAEIWVASGNPQLTLLLCHHSSHISPTTFPVKTAPEMAFCHQRRIVAGADAPELQGKHWQTPVQWCNGAMAMVVMTP